VPSSAARIGIGRRRRQRRLLALLVLQGALLGIAPLVLSPGLAPTDKLGAEVSAEVGTWLQTERMAMRPSAHLASSFLPPSSRGIPAVASSQYLRTTSPPRLRALGCSEARQLDRRKIDDALVVLAFGRPRSLHGLWGTTIFGGGFQSTWKIQVAAQSFAVGFWNCTPGSSPIHLRVAIGTSNFGPQVTYQHGMTWGRMVNAANAWLWWRGYQRRFDFAGADDIELAWNRPGPSKRWVQGYGSVAESPYFDYGDAADCPPVGRNCLGSWTPEDVWYVSWGAPAAWPLPQVYTPRGTMARQWHWLSLYSYRHHGIRMTIVGALSQKKACVQSHDPCRGMNNSPRTAWRQLYESLNRDPRTAQTLPWLTDIRWEG